MPLTDKGDKIMSSMKEQYGDQKGESVFYASKNKGTIKGVDEEPPPPPPTGPDCDDKGNLIEQRDELAKDNAGYGTLGTPAAAAAPDDFGGLQQGLTFVPEIKQRIDQLTQQLHRLASHVDRITRR